MLLESQSKGGFEGIILTQEEIQEILLAEQKRAEKLTQFYCQSQAYWGSPA